jgi:hypothetical protein
LRRVGYGDDLAITFSKTGDNGTNTITLYDDGYDINQVDASSIAEVQINGTFEANKTYVLAGDYTVSSGGFKIDQSNLAGGSITVSGYTVFRPLTAVTSIGIYRNVIPSAATFRNVSVREVFFDRATDDLVLFNHPDGMPRIEYGSDGTLKGLLIEEQRTNLLLNSDNPDTQVATLAAGSHTLSFVGGPSVTGISDSIDDNAVDVFVYDTSKDSDGGAWRTGSLAQASSWYAEASSPTRDPETRSTRAEFPAVAVIVAESNKVTIYDGDDPSLPMWMVFNRPTSFITTLLWPWSTVTATAIAALNGTLAFASTGSSRFKTVNFIDEVSYQWGLTQSYKGNVPISERDTSWTNTVPITGTVVSTELNDVAMTVLPNAPTDPATGLKVPTIAVATEGGVSVIKDDGTVVDITSNFGSTYSVCKSVSFSSANDLKFLMGYSGYTSFFTKPIPASDQTVITVQSDPTDKDFMWGGYNLPAILFGGNAVTARLDNYFADELGLTIGSEADTPSKNMVAYTTSDYTTGWMPGDIKLAALANSATADRSVNNNPLTQNGTITAAPVATGADVVAYSGFSNNNYLEQPYNDDLDFGEGDFCVMGWFKENSLDSLAYLLSRDTASTAQNFNVYLQSGQLTFKLDDDRCVYGGSMATFCRRKGWRYRIRLHQWCKRGVTRCVCDGFSDKHFSNIALGYIRTGDKPTE